MRYRYVYGGVGKTMEDLDPPYTYTLKSGSMVLSLNHKPYVFALRQRPRPAPLAEAASCEHFFQEPCRVQGFGFRFRA